MDQGPQLLAGSLGWRQGPCGFPLKSSWKKHWGLRCLQAQGWGLEETRQQTGPFVFSAQGEREVTYFIPSQLTQENCLTKLHILQFLRQSRRIWENRNNGNCNKWIDFILTQSLGFRSVYSILKSLSSHPDPLPYFLPSRAPAVWSKIEQQPAHIEIHQVLSHISSFCRIAQ